MFIHLGLVASQLINLMRRELKNQALKAGERVDGLALKHVVKLLQDIL
ncbi:MAG: hypothetical protein JNK41_07015 [Saprospiraceae bacterium]|nr:hypothetical protein [Saprospiraceae bacterium]